MTRAETDLARPKEWYDAVMVEHGSPAMIPLEESPWLPLYQEVAELIGPEEEVVDLGCGTGRFIKLLLQRDHYAKITGIDWSVEALDVSMRYCGSGPFHHEFMGLEWITADLDDWTPGGDRSGNTVYVCTEVLEHLPDDIDLVRRIPPGHRFIFSVPNYDSESHVRTFRDVHDAWSRYDHLLRFRRWILIGNERRAVHVYEARRRGDSW